MPETTPSSMTYNSLVQDIKDYLERGNEADETVLRQIPRIISNTERTLADRLKITGYIGSFVGTMQSGNNRIAKPDNWRSTVSINYGGGATYNTRTTLRARAYEYMRARFPNDQELNAPQFYCDYDLAHWLFLPTPADTYPFEAMVYYLPPLLGETQQQNYLTRFAPFLLLYSVLSGMEPFLRNDARLAVWKQLAEDNFAAINVEDLRRMVDRGQVRDTN